MHPLYIPMSRKEQNMGLGLLVLMLGSALLLPPRSVPLGEFAHWGLFFTAVVIVFHRFLAASAQIPLTPVLTIGKFALLGYSLAFLANLLTNDLIYYFLPKYFYYNETGPHFINLCKIHVGALAAVNFPLIAATTILFAPVVEEVLFRGLIFGNLLRKNLPLAYLVSTILYCLVLNCPILSEASVDYIILSLIQYLPINLMFCWIYTRTETILTPILAHMVMNGISILTLR